ncbi:MAG TPA: patatin-like phospholipase family protein [Chitinophagaceae bacterium]|nr:patatin-like phospholipase family protein [Chitinophagaceae bacterium]
MKFWLTLCCCLLYIASTSQDAGKRPSIGLTLSGGGAKGLAHIGILKAIDSAGLQIDYITGTSMGSVVGGLYAIGYSGDTLEKMAREVDWDLLLSNQSSLRGLFMEEKSEYSKYVVELPWVNHGFRLPTGVLEGQELWLKLTELFAPVYDKKFFSQFSIPFRCIATDVGNGQAVVLSKGEIVSAIRSSMAIPSLFTAVDVDGKKMVDGGIVRNFPVQDVKDMGADIVIGSNVAMGLLTSDKVRNVIHVLLQVAFFREAEDNRKEVPLCDIYIPMPLQDYSMGSFSQASEIMNIGIEQGRKLYPRFKQLADSLNAIYGVQERRPNRLPPMEAILISSADVKGTNETTVDFFLHTMDFQTNKKYTINKLNAMVRKAYGTRYYSRIIYSLIPQEDGSCRISFEVAENPLTFAKFGIHYNRFTGIGLIGNITSRNFFIKNSRSLVTINLGETFRIRGEHLQYLGRKKDFSLGLSTQFDRFDITTYDQFRQDGVYNQNYFVFDSRLQYSTSRNFSVGAGSKYEWVYYSPSITSRLSFRGNNDFVTNYAFISHNTLNKNVYPKRGFKMDAVVERVGTQHPNLEFFQDGKPVTDPDTTAITTSPYERATLNMEGYTPLSSKSTLMMSLQGGVNFKYKRHVMNEFVVGGLTRLFRNQVTFAGLQEGTLYTPSVLAAQAGLRYEVFNNTYIMGRANLLLTNFVSKSNFFQNPNFLTGYALTFAYNFALGPLEISAMYSGQSKRLSTYINLGIAF